MPVIFLTVEAVMIDKPGMLVVFVFVPVMFIVMVIMPYARSWAPIPATIIRFIRSQGEPADTDA
jgi:hypothetical protein